LATASAQVCVPLGHSSLFESASVREFDQRSATASACVVVCCGGSVVSSRPQCTAPFSKWYLWVDHWLIN